METSSERQEEKSIMVLWESGKTVHGFVRAFSRKTASVFFFLLRSQIFGVRQVCG